MKLKHTFLAAMLLSPLTLAATTSGQTDVSRQESTQRADSAQQNLQQQAGQWGL
ncbi:TIGR03759 family integrating conjugative element protein, partial [Salmonella enterica subsp. enterica serovar Schwarzengrund]|nr:TIGR03759 family integrating conjugative element protein [Salmonella enterica subsp. enterica serovar Schwarzengrund]EIK9651508.1 TIGR03759 family integrating conjugative element protein [Salmonella enterica subsp. enterica serovar Schwarzengrund]